MEAELLDTWYTHSRVVFYLLEAVDAAGLQSRAPAMRGRSVAHIFAHMHNKRLEWLEVNAPELLGELFDIPTDSSAARAEITKDVLWAALAGSDVALEALFIKGMEEGYLIACKNLVACFAYFIAHEWYHVGEICMILTQAGQRLPSEVLAGIWEWGEHEVSDE